MPVMFDPAAEQVFTADQVRRATRPGAAVFMEPGSKPHVTAVPGVPVRHKKGRVRAQ